MGKFNTYKITKYILDKTLAFLLLIILAPLMVAIVIAIKLTSAGPVLFSHVRVGKNGKRFNMYKFRTMHINLDLDRDQDYVNKLLKGDYGALGEQPFLKLAQDPRITAVGRFLRLTAMDELPELFNVLKGEMSLVGPRPSMPFEVKHYESWHKNRLTVEPGLTGLWQISGRSRTTFEEMLEIDSTYINNRSILLDIKILLKTIKVVLKGQGAY